MSRTLTWHNCKTIHLLFPQDRWSGSLGLKTTFIYKTLCERRVVYNVILGYALEECKQEHQTDSLLLHEHSLVAHHSINHSQQIV